MKTTMKQSKGFIETAAAVETERGVEYMYKRLRTKAVALEETVEVKHEVVTTGSMVDEEWVERRVEEALKRIDAKIVEFREQTEIKQQAYQVVKKAHEAAKKERRRMRPKNKVHMVMDAMGIDRRCIYNMLCEIEKRMAN